MAPSPAPLTGVNAKPMHPAPVSGYPVRYFNGELQLAADDLGTAGYGMPFGHTRIFSNRLGGDLAFGSGTNWMVRQLPQAYQQGGSVMVLRGSRSALWFDSGPGGGYTARYSAKFKFSPGNSFTLAAPNGETTVFNDFSSANPGLLKSVSTASGQTLNVTSYAANTNLGIGEVQRGYTSGGVATIESYVYTSSGQDLSGVLVRRSTDGGNSWSNIRQVTYTYL